MAEPKTAGAFPSLATDPQSVRRRVEGLERVMERLVVVPGINRPLGLDVILDFVPFAGPTAAAAIGTYLAWEARNIGMSKWQMTRLGGNIGVGEPAGIGLANFDRVAEESLEFLRRYARKVTVLHQGRVLREGSVAEVQDDPRVREVYLGRAKGKAVT